MQQLLQEIQSPAVLSTCLAALESPSLQLRVLQYKLWKVRRAGWAAHTMKAHRFRKTGLCEGLSQYTNRLYAGWL
jgi:hypothetical protein